jgi:hypothetical protein
MYEESEPELTRILGLVKSCPEALRETAFKILLEGYVASLVGKTRATTPSTAPPTDPLPPQGNPATDESWREGIPEEVLPRFQTMASRIKVSPDQLADLFDFSTDPFAYAAIHIEGKSNRERVCRVALLVAARSYLATGKWSADWAEIKAMCTHQNCYDVNNFSSSLSRAEGDWLKTVNSGSSVQTSAKGQKEAERLLATLAGRVDAPKE